MVMQKVNVSKEVTIKKKSYSALKKGSNFDIFSLFSTVASATFKEKSFPTLFSISIDEQLFIV